mmetsp:Transcript_10233/g.9041  ORF Transcript_10233/g.9041 Transcript_10233/m.9041 type:complete len:220 (+) Transcript_10233:240-899(+)
MESLQKLFYEIKGEEPDGKSKLGDSYLYIDCRNEWTLKLLNMLAGEINLQQRIVYILPKEIKGVGVGYLDERCEPVKRFLSKCIQHELEWLWINYIALDKWEKQYRLGISEYMPVIESVAPKVTKWIGLNYFKIDSLQMSKIFKACYQVEKVDFDNCSFKIEKSMDFGGDSYKIEKISMEDTFIKTISLKNSKRDNKQPVKNFLTAISKSTLKESLTEI